MKGSKLFFAVLMLIIQIVDMQYNDTCYYYDVKTPDIIIKAHLRLQEKDTTKLASVITLKEDSSIKPAKKEIIYP